MKNLSQPKTLYVTRALTPPWDEASKNFAHDLAKHVTDVDLTIMTSGHLDDMPDTVHQADIYSPAAPSTFSTRQKFESIWYQWRHKRRFDLIHYFFTPAKLNSFLIRHFLRGKHTKTVQTVATLRNDLLSIADFHKILFADRLVTYTKHAQANLVRIGFTNVEHVYPGINLTHYTPGGKNPRIMEHFAIPDDAFTVLYPGEYIRLGATDTIINALIALWQSNAPRADKTILILGLRVKNDADARKKNDIMQKVADAGFVDRVRYTDTFADMRGLYNLADIVLFPVANMNGKFDVPLALIEAYACGKPTIVSNIPRLKEFTNTDISVIIESENAPALTTAIADLAADTSRRSALGSAARAFTEDQFDITKTTQHYERIYREVCGRD